MRLETRLRSAVMRRLASPGYQRFRQARARLGRRLSRQPATVHYFHQADDPYSHLAVQKLDELRNAYKLPFVPHLVPKPEPDYLGSAEHFDAWARRDAASISEAYGVRFPESPQPPEPAQVEQANRLLAACLGSDDFARKAAHIGDALWSGALEPCDEPGKRAQDVITEGNRLRHRLGHYGGAMFYFDGEWYWGVDRLRLLEERLIREGFAAGPAGIRVPEPTVGDPRETDTKPVQLEYFPSLRSPYTAVGHARVLDLIRRRGVAVRLRPVMPMLMRGVPAPRAKQHYIITDAAREGRAHGSPLGRIVDPFGEPVRRAFALFPGAAALGREMAYITEYLRAAWVDGVDITTEQGLRTVVERAGMDWTEVTAAARDQNWEDVLEENLQTMSGAGLWGVPSFRVTGGAGTEPFACWGQDRIWRVETEILRRARRAKPASPEPGREGR